MIIAFVVIAAIATALSFFFIRELYNFDSFAKEIGLSLVAGIAIGAAVYLGYLFYVATLVS